MRLCIVGVGALGSAIVERLLATGTPTSELLLIERSVTKAEQRRSQFGCFVSLSSELASPQATSNATYPDFIFLTVKPQDFQSVGTTVRSLLSPHTVVVSCMAGVSTTLIMETLQHPLVIRSMPNLGTRIGESATVFFAPPEISPLQMQKTQEVLSRLGRGWQVEREDLLNAATAIAGSGPAYVCWLAEAMQRAAEQLGIPTSDSHELVLQTLRATVDFLCQSELSFEHLREKVTSRGGTTAAALSVLSDHGAHEIFTKAIQAAHRRSRELGSTSPRVTES